MSAPTVDETIRWHRAVDDLPDSDTTVLVYCPDDDEPVWLGWYDSDKETWYSVDASEVMHVHAWADLPAGGVP